MKATNENRRNYTSQPDVPTPPESFETVVVRQLQAIEKSTKTTADWMNFFGVVSIIGAVLWVIISIFF